MRVHRQGKEAGMEYISTHYIEISPTEKMEKFLGLFLKVKVSWIMGWDCIKKMGVRI